MSSHKEAKKNQKTNKNWQEKTALLGLGKDNQALLKLLKEKKIKTNIVIKDYKLDPINFNKNLSEFDILFRSPGWPISCPGIQEAIKQGKIEIVNPLDIFFTLCPSKNIIGVTGTKGKGTVSTLIYKILRDAGKRAWLGGNIGIPPLSFLTKIKRDDYIVLELSSFQLEDLKHSPKIAVITNLYKEHLAPADPFNPNFHKSFAAYWKAKLNIAAGKENKYLIANEKLTNRLKKSKIKSRTVFFSSSSLPSKLIGDFNRENIAAAVAAADILKIKPEIYEKTINRFKNLEHRLELAVEKNGVKYFNNSFSTTPESTILDLQSFSEPIILLAGGADKGADFQKLAKAIKNKVKFLILLKGQATKRIKKELLAINFPKSKISETDNMREAIAISRRKASAGDIVLLSTACASFGIFKNYKERGNLFKKYAAK